MYINEILMLITILLLAIVGGFVLWLHLRLEKLMVTQELPGLGQDLLQAIMQAKKALIDLREELEAIEPTVNQSIRNGRKVVQDLSFFCDHGEKLLNRMEQGFETAKQVEKQQTTGIEGALQQSSSATSGAAGAQPAAPTGNQPTNNRAEDILRTKLERQV